MTVKASQSFAARRQAIILTLRNEIFSDLLPKFNAEAEDIRRKYEEAIAVASDAPTDNAKNSLTELAEATKKARILDLNKRKNEFIESMRLTLRMEQKSTIDDYKGELFEEKEETKEGKERTVEKVKFPDGSIAKVAKNIFIDYSAFVRI